MRIFLSADKQTVITVGTVGGTREEQRFMFIVIVQGNIYTKR